MNKIFKLQIITLIILILQSSITFAAVSGFVDSKQVTQRRPMGVDFNSNGTKMFVVGTVENKIFEFDLTTGFDVSTATKNSNECDFAGIGSDVVDIEFNSDGTKLFLVDIGGDDAIEEFDLSTAYDVSTCTNVEEHFAGDFKLVGI